MFYSLFISILVNTTSVFIFLKTLYKHRKNMNKMFLMKSRIVQVQHPPYLTQGKFSLFSKLKVHLKDLRMWKALKNTMTQYHTTPKEEF